MSNIKIKNQILFLVLMSIFTLLFALVILPKFGVIGTDTSLYAIIGRNIVEGRGFTLFGEPHTYFSPLLPVFIGIFYFLIGNLEIAAYSATIFFALLSLPLFYYLVKQITCTKTAMLAVLFYTFSGFIIWSFSTQPTPQIPAAFFSILTFLALFKVSYLKDRVRYQNIIWFFIVGASIGLAYLTRVEYFFVIFPVIIYIVFIRRKKYCWRLTNLMVITAIMGFLIFVIPYLLFLHKHLDCWTISGRSNTVSLYIVDQDLEIVDENSDITHFADVVIPPEVENGMIATFVKNTGPLIKRFLDNLFVNQLEFLKVFGILGISFFALGLKEFIFAKRFRELWLFVISFTPFCLITLVVQGGKTNYLVQFFYLFIIFISIGFWAFYDQFNSRFKINLIKKKVVFYVLILIFIVYSLFFPVIQHYLFSPKDFTSKEYKMIGHWIQNNIPNHEQETIFARKPEISFYAESEWQLIPKVKDVNTLVKIMKNYKINYIVVDDRAFRDTRPELNILLDIPNAPEELIFLKQVEHYGKRAILYKLKSEK